MGNTVSETQKYLLIVKQENQNLPLCPFIHCIKDVVIDGEYVGLDSINLYKEKEILLEVLDILTLKTFFVQIDKGCLTADGALGMNITCVYEIPYVPAIQVISTKNPLFRAKDQIIGLEGKDNLQLLEQLEKVVHKRIAVIREKKILIVESSDETLGCEIGVGLIYKAAESDDIYTEGYNGKAVKHYSEDVEAEKMNADTGYTKIENNNQDPDVFSDAASVITTNDDSENPISFRDVVNNEEELVTGQTTFDFPTAAHVVNDQFVCDDDYADKGILKDEAFDERMRNKTSSKIEINKPRPSTVSNSKLSQPDDFSKFAMGENEEENPFEQQFNSGRIFESNESVDDIFSSKKEDNPTENNNQQIHQNLNQNTNRCSEKDGKNHIYSDPSASNESASGKNVSQSPNLNAPISPPRPEVFEAASSLSLSDRDNLFHDDLSKENTNPNNSLSMDDFVDSGEFDIFSGNNNTEGIQNKMENIQVGETPDNNSNNIYDSVTDSKKCIHFSDCDCDANQENVNQVNYNQEYPDQYEDQFTSAQYNDEYNQDEYYNEDDQFTNSQQDITENREPEIKPPHKEHFLSSSDEENEFVFPPRKE